MVRAAESMMVLLLLVGSATGSAAGGLSTTSAGDYGSAGSARSHARVRHITDGDTIVVELGARQVTVRLLGVDAPESKSGDKLRRDSAHSGQDAALIQSLGRASTQYLRSLVPPGSYVELEYERGNVRDRYGRLLAWVFYGGELVNTRLVCDGYAAALTRYPLRPDYEERLRACERQARASGHGLWGDGWRPAGGAVNIASAPSAQVAPATHGGGDRWPCPQARAIKGNHSRSGGCIYHVPGQEYYASTNPEECFATHEEAQQAGCRASRR